MSDCINESSDYISEYFAPFGVQRYHNECVFGKILAGPAMDTKIKVYIIDTGFDDTDPNLPGIQTHLDLSSVTVRNFSNEEGSPTVPSHGSLTAALMAAPLNNFGILGVCPDATVYLGDVDNADARLYQTNIVQALLDAVSLGVDIIVMPLGASTLISSMEAALRTAIEAGIYIFGSAGNSGLLRYDFPAAFPGVISVASVNLDNQPSSFNTRNERVALFAPGENYFLPSSVGPVRVSGTSFAAPFAAGLAALHLAKERATNPAYKPTRPELISILRNENHLDNGDLSYPAVLGPTNESESSLFDFLMPAAPYLGGFFGLVIILYIYMVFRDSSRKKKFIKAQKCALEGDC